MNALQQYANHLISKGWTINSMTDQQFIATKRKGINGFVVLIGIVGLFFYLIPGLLILLIGYVARGTETRIVTVSEAEEWIAEKEADAEEADAEEVAELSEDSLSDD